MPNYPVIERPLILTYRGHIPALKNDKTLTTDKKGNARLIKNDSVVSFMRQMRKPLKEQVKAAGFSTIEMPSQVGVIAIVRFFSKNPPSTSDGDNAYTTLQETLQQERFDDKGKITRQGIAGVFEDDRQVSLGLFSVRYVAFREMEGAEVIIWKRPDNQDDMREIINAYEYGFQALAVRMEVTDISEI